MINFFKDEDIKEFLKGQGKTLEAETVEELIYILQQLPPKFKIEQGCEQGVSVCIYNLHRRNPHIDFSEWQGE